MNRLSPLCRRGIRTICGFILGLGLAANPFGTVTGQIPDNATADLVLGQPNFESANSGLSANSLANPSAVAIDPLTGKVFVSDQNNHRILRFRSFEAIVTLEIAEAVIGQPDFVTNVPGTTQRQLNTPIGMMIDRSGRLWVADTGNNRVLMFEAVGFRGNFPYADLVLGQPDFNSALAASGSAGLDEPVDLVFDDANDRLWVSDLGNNRVLGYNNASAGGGANRVIGQTNFLNNAAGISQSELSGPFGLELDGDSLWIADATNSRVVRYDDVSSIVSGTNNAAVVLGQPDFNTNAAGLSQTALNTVTDCELAPDGTLWVADTGNRRILAFPNPATIASGAAAQGFVGQVDYVSAVVATTAQNFSLPYQSIAFDPSGALWVPDYLANRVLRFSRITPTPPEPTPPEPLVGRPTLSIKGKKTVRTKRNRVVVKGTASSAAGIEKVEYKTGRNGFNPTRGTNSWRAVVRLNRLQNRAVARIRAIGNDGSRSKVVRVRVLRSRSANVPE